MDGQEPTVPDRKVLAARLAPADLQIFAYGEITGGKVWEAAQQFRDAGVAKDEVWRLQQWGIVFTDRAARLQYH